MLDVARYLKDYGTPYFEAGHPKVTKGWIGITCPFCQDHGVHGGFNLEKSYYTCWICGWHDLVDVIAALERIKPHEAASRLVSYEIISQPRAIPSLEKKGSQTTSLPVGSGPLGAIHKSYLTNRKFNPEYLENKYGLKGTGPIGPYKFRIIAPIHLGGELISYQGRDVTGKSKIPYKACPKDQEVVEHKNSLYNVDNAGDAAIVVEGIFDVWRLGDGAVATFGVGFRWTQVNMMAERFKKVFLLYDGEPKAQAQARKIVRALASLGVETENILLGKGDPAEMPQEEADKLKEELLK